MDVRKLRVLCELDARGTIAEVATALHLTPSGVSQQLAALSREVGAQLIEPVGRRVQLTGAARILVEHGHEILAQVERAYASISDYVTGDGSELRIAGHHGTLAGIGLPTLVRLRDIRSDLNVSLRDVEPVEATAMLLRGEVDVVVGFASGFGSTIDDVRLFATRLHVDHFDLVLPSRHRLAHTRSIKLLDLASDTWIFGSADLCHEIGLVACRAAGFTPTTTQMMGDWASALAAVRLGLGVALMPRLVLAEPPTEVVTRQPAGDPLQYQLITMVRRGSETAPPVALVLDTMDQVVQDLTVPRAA